MFEEETIDIACPKCGHSNPILVREFEDSAEIHFACVNCKAGVKVEAKEFRHRLDEVLKEVRELEREAAKDARRPPKRPRKGDFQI